MSSDSTEADRQHLLQAASAFRTSQALYVVAKLGIPDLLQDGPKTSEELATKAGAHPRALFRVMRALAALGFFTQDGSNRFGLTPKTRPLLSDTPDSVRASVIFFGQEQYRATGELLHTVQTGETSFDHLYGMGHFEYLSRHPDASVTFNAAMGAGLRQSENPIARYSFSGRRVVVDVGGGRGDQIASILRANPKLKGILYDLPQVAADARAYLKANGLSDRCDLVTGNAFESIPRGGDVYLMSRVLHDWPDDKAATLLANCRKAIPTGGILLIRDGVLPEGDAAAQATQMDLTMLIMTGGLERTEADWRSLLRGAGFALASVTRANSPFDLIEAKPI
jgi:SAM-dependent methyltransferase